jgi:predicted phosphodiesterase
MLAISFAILMFVSASVVDLTAYSQNVTNHNSTNSLVNENDKLDQTRITIIDAVGDLECSKILHDRIKSDNPDIFVALGDLCYKPDLSNFTETYSDFKEAEKIACVVGNHESLENGNLKILNQTLNYCGDHWYRKVANDTTILLGLNTNGNTSFQSNWGKSLVSNTTLMEGIKNVMLFTHKPAHTPPGSDHIAENSTIQMISEITSNLPKDIQVYEIAAHNHLMAESSNGQWFISGAGGRRLYEFSTDPSWSFVNNKEHGYLQIRINITDGLVLSTNFYGLDGRLIH